MPETKRKREHERASLNWKDKSEILKSCGGLCAHCGKKITDDFTVEHMIPLSQGGDNSPENLAALCEACNLEKADRVVEPRDYYIYLPKKKLKAVQEKFDRFCDDKDWMTTRNLFRTDEFTLKAEYRLLLKLGIDIMPTVFTVKKLSRQNTLEFMHGYIRAHGHRPTVPAVVDEITQPYYEVAHNGNRVAVFTVGFMTLNDYLEDEIRKDEACEDIDLSDLPWLTLTTIDVFSDPGIPEDRTAYAAQKIRFVFHGLQAEIQKTLKRKGRHDGLRMLWSADRVDKTASMAFGYEQAAGTFHGINDAMSATVKRPNNEYANLDVFLMDAVGHLQAMAQINKWMDGWRTGEIKGKDVGIELMKTYGQITKNGNRRLMSGDGYAKTPKKQKARENGTR